MRHRTGAPTPSPGEPLLPVNSEVGLRRLALVAVGLREARKAVAGKTGDAVWNGLSTEAQLDLRHLAEDLHAHDIRMLVRGDRDWPLALEDLSTPPLYLFCKGNLDLLTAPGIGMCGSRKASSRGLAAAQVCGNGAAREGLNVVSGYAAGVDTETHLAALQAGGSTTIVLPEGILGFKLKRAFSDAGFDDNNAVVVSQFPPKQRWTAGGAMTRNGVICALGRALVVVEAGERGGTLNAGRQALKTGRPVLALEFGDGGGATPAGNELLFADGARRVATHGQLREAFLTLRVPSS